MKRIERKCANVKGEELVKKKGQDKNEGSIVKQRSRGKREEGIKKSGENKEDLGGDMSTCMNITIKNRIR